MNQEQQKQTAVLSLAQYSSMVSPENCELLAQAGVTMLRPLYKWVIIGQQAHIRSYLYDHDGYYRNADKLIDMLHKPCQLTAYTIGMLEEIMPPYTICKSACGNYEIMCDKHYSVKEIYAPRMPDAIALMLLELLNKRRITPQYVNNILNHKRL